MNIPRANIARHRRACPAGEGDGRVRGDVRPQGVAQARVYRARRKMCEVCGVEQAATNMARYRRKCGGQQGERDIPQQR